MPSGYTLIKVFLNPPHFLHVPSRPPARALFVVVARAPLVGVSSSGRRVWRAVLGLARRVRPSGRTENVRRPVSPFGEGWCLHSDTLVYPFREGTAHSERDGMRHSRGR